MSSIIFLAFFDMCFDCNACSHKGRARRANLNVYLQPLRSMRSKGKDSASDGGANEGAEGTEMQRKPERSRTDVFAKHREGDTYAALRQP